MKKRDRAPAPKLPPMAPWAILELWRVVTRELDGGHWERVMHHIHPSTRLWGACELYRSDGSHLATLNEGLGYEYWIYWTDSKDPENWWLHPTFITEDDVIELESALKRAHQRANKHARKAA